MCLRHRLVLCRLRCGRGIGKCLRWLWLSRGRGREIVRLRVCRMSVVFLGGEVVSYYGIDAFILTQAVYGYYFAHHGAKDYIDCGFLVGSHFRSLICVVKGYLLNVVLTLCLQYFKRSSWTLRLPTLLYYIYFSVQYRMYMVIGICTASCRSPTRVVGHKVPMNVFPCLIFHSPPTVM